LLEPHGIAVTPVARVEEALASLAQQRPDVIISDVHIGKERGVDFFARVKAQPATASIPFVFITSTALHVTDRLHTLTSGADCFIVRPIDGARLLAEIEACLALHKEP
jgi:DNA-binding response OmpR family regulator